MTELEDRELRAKFFRFIFGERNGYICIGSESSVKGDFRQRFFQWPLAESELLRYVEKQATSGRNVWFGINLLKTKFRKKEVCLPANLIWADLDDCDPDSTQPLPQVVIESSPGRYQAIWRVDEELDPYIAEDYSRRIYGRYRENGVDSGWALTKLLRIPFTRNVKAIYPDHPPVKLLRAVKDLLSTELFDAIVTQASTPEDIELEKSIPELLDAEEIIAKNAVRLKHKGFDSIWAYEPTATDDWSRLLWRLMLICFESGLTKEETFTVANASSVNKYARDKKPLRYLWADVGRAAVTSKKTTAGVKIFTMPELIPGDDYKFKKQSFIEEYTDWGKNATDACPQYHDLSAFILLSSILAGSIKLETSFGTIRPNLWGLILGDSTLTRKAQPLDAKILTPAGWKAMGDIQIDDEVIGKNGKPTKVIGVFPQGEQDSYKVTFGDGASTECSEDHLWAITGRGNRQRNYGVWPLSKLKERGLQSSGQWSRYIPQVDPIELSKQELPIDPYVFGLLLGDGSFSDKTVRFTSADEELVDAVIKEAVVFDLELKYLGNYQYHLSSAGTTNYGFQGRPNEMLQVLRDIELYGKRSHEKFVPEIYLNGSIKQRLALLQGLMDTDGWINKNSCNFTSSSLELAEAVQYLTRSLGGWSKLIVHENSPYKDINYVSVSLPLGMNPFRLQRKADELYDKAWYRPRSMRSIECVGKKMMQCIRVEAEDGLYVTDDFIVTHNSTAMRMATDIIDFVDRDILLATDGSAEGILTGLAGRPGRTSMFYRDEVVGFFREVVNKQYLSGLPQTFTQLYDGGFMARRLRKELITVTDPVFIFYGGGIKDQFYSSVDIELIYSGFLPRFLIVLGETALSDLKRIGPPTAETTEQKQDIYARLHKMHQDYSVVGDVEILGQPAKDFISTDAQLDADAWLLVGEIEERMVLAAHGSTQQGLALPTFERLSRSMLKMGILIAASRQQPDGATIIVTTEDIRRAASYIQVWGEYTIEVIQNAGQTIAQKVMERVLKFIADNSGSNRGEVMRSMNLDKREMQIIEETLEARGQITVAVNGKNRSYSTL